MQFIFVDICYLLLPPRFIVRYSRYRRRDTVLYLMYRLE